MPNYLFCVRSLLLDGLFERGRFLVTPERPWYFPHVNPYERAVVKAGLECEVQASRLLSEMAKLLPALTTVVLDVYDYETPKDKGKFWRKSGVPLSVILALFSIPHLRHFTVVGYIFHPADTLSAFPADVTLPPLVSFKYILCNIRAHPRSFNSEMELLHNLIPRLHLSLETLHIPSESAPLKGMYNRDWPRLRNFYIYGQRRTVVNPPIPYILMLARMPELRTLHLLFAHPKGLPPQPIWPRGFSATYPWPNLKELTITHPHAEDELWTHLPLGLRYLALRCWPRRSMVFADRLDPESLLSQLDLGWHTPLPSTAEMHTILRSCNIPNLTYLEIEYWADHAEEEELLERISRGFPALESLQLHRYYRHIDRLKEPLVSDL